MTLAVRLGDSRTRGAVRVPRGRCAGRPVGVVLGTTWWAALALAYLVPAGRAVSVVRRASGRDLVPALQLTGVAELAYGLGLFVGLVVGAA